MKHLLAALMLVSLWSPAAGATESGEVPAREVIPRIVGGGQAPPAKQIQLVEVAVEERTAEADVAAAQLPARGSFWWMVGVIVVAGVILAVLL